MAIKFDPYKCGTFGPEHFEVGETVRIYHNNVESAVIWVTEGRVSKLDNIDSANGEMVHLKVFKRGVLGPRGGVSLKPIKVYGGRIPYLSIGHVEKTQRLS